MTLNASQRALCEGHSFDFSGLSALFLNCTLKPSGSLFHTEKLLEVPRAIMASSGVAVEILPPVDFDLPPGVYPDLEPDAHGAHAPRCEGDSRLRQSKVGVGCRLPLRPSRSGLSLKTALGCDRLKWCPRHRA